MERMDEDEHFSSWQGENPNKMPVGRVKQLFDEAYDDPNPGILRLTMALITDEEWQEYAELVLSEVPSE